MAKKPTPETPAKEEKKADAKADAGEAAKLRVEMAVMGFKPHLIDKALTKVKKMELQEVMDMVLKLQEDEPIVT